ncbi:hypothetical protein [Pengzhenrongella sicca]|uniref:Uncharacterized protein n=1 Tax=Pengzhenrongella sicca TaxID=2819238 RepID=A0A8A4ZG28_9MICO|nr:hypothetical protein [Pengzhenrongella sicca]QTE29949.1 hypothetical protein J4E96_02680 [Pengzhenrongella sicca]
MQHGVIGALVTPTAAAGELVAGRGVVLADPHSVDGLWSVVDADVTHCVLLGERQHESLVRRHAALLSDRGVAVAWRVVPHGPAAVVAIALEAATQQLDAGQVPEYLGELAARTWSGAWMPSVAKLEKPAPSVLQHLRSLAPGGNGFLVSLSGDADVVAVGTATNPRTRGYRCTSVISVSAAMPEPALRDVLTLCGAGERIVVPALSFDPRERFGSAKAIEMVALPVGNEIPMPLADSLPRCVVCAAVVPAEFCSFCHVRLVRDPLEHSGVQ